MNIKIKPLPEDASTRGIADIVLGIFYEANHISIDDWNEYRESPHYNEVMTFLVAEGFLEKTPRSIKITYKGRLKVDDGGFVGAFKRERDALRLSRLATFVSAAAAASSIAALVVAIVK